jgi:hypothetical protein
MLRSPGVCVRVGSLSGIGRLRRSSGAVYPKSLASGTTRNQLRTRPNAEPGEADYEPISQLRILTEDDTDIIGVVAAPSVLSDTGTISHWRTGAKRTVRISTRDGMRAHDHSISHNRV